MKYIVKYSVGNGYSCSCCGIWYNEEEEYSDQNEALNRAAELMAAYKNDYLYHETIAMAEGPEDFIKDEYGDWNLNFDLNEFDDAARKLVNEIKAKNEERKKKEEEAQKIKNAKKMEEREKREYERLKEKFG